jgi:hypothetical protein
VAICTPRPTIGLSTTATGDGRLAVTLRAPSSANDALLSLQIGAATNALVDVAGSTGITGNATVTLPANTQSLTFYVRQRVTGQAVTVPLVVADRCGSWPTFVGAGSSAFASAASSTSPSTAADRAAVTPTLAPVPPRGRR